MKIVLKEWQIFRKDYFIHFILMNIVFFVSAFGCYFVFQAFPEETTKLMGSITEMFESKGLHEKETDLEMSIGLFLNNSFASLLMFLSGSIPIVIMPFIYVIMNGSIIGVLFAFMAIEGEPVLELIVKGILPHGIFEIPAILYAASLGSYISLTIIKKLIGGKYKEIKLWDEYKKTFASFLIVVIPLLIIAAIVEGFITPVLLGK